jgi:hypothetical protein
MDAFTASKLIEFIQVVIAKEIHGFVLQSSKLLASRDQLKNSPRRTQRKRF